MLHLYPEEAVSDNWLHESLVAMLGSVHSAISAGKRIPKWQVIIPHAHRGALVGRRGLRDRLSAYAKAYAALPEAERDDLRTALRDQNQIAALLRCEASCSRLADVAEGIRPVVSELFKFAFALLTDLGVRDRHYTIVYGGMPYQVCPFCGFEYFDAPGGAREDLDHYLSRDSYPFAAANLRNLVPMGSKCNSGYKLATDILYSKSGDRRKSFDPYGTVIASVSLSRSRLFERNNGVLPTWIIDLRPDCEESATWDQVFHVRERYQRDLLDVDFSKWLDRFASFCRSSNVDASTDSSLVDALARYADYLADAPMQDRNFLRLEVFNLFRAYCRDGDKRTINFLRDIAQLRIRPKKATP